MALLAVVKEFLGALVVSGPERATWLQGMVSNDVLRLQAGEGCYAAHLTSTGKVVSDMTVLVDAEQILLVVESSVRTRLAQTLDRLLIMEDAAIAEADLGVVALVGAASGDVWTAALGLSVLPPRLFEHVVVPRGRVFRTELGFDVILDRDAVQPFLDALVASGVTRGSFEQWNDLRIAAGIPRMGVDFSDATLLPELGERAISYDKGCYIGQEVVAKVKYIGHVNRKVVGVRSDDVDALVPGLRLWRADREVGTVTSASRTAVPGSAVGLATLQRGSEMPGTILKAGASPDAASVEVVPRPPLPFVPGFEV